MSKCPLHHKVRYPTQRAAIRSALKCSSRRGTPLRVYFHKACGGYHLTSAPLRDVDTTDRSVA